MADWIPTKSLPLKITGAPAETVCYALEMIDYDAQGFVHWIAADFTSNELAAGASIASAGSMVQGVNDYGGQGYGGPYPPETHKYTIKVYALSEKLNLTSGFNYQQFSNALSGKVLATGTLTAKYSA